ncbi:hypothetical protein [uncultured Kordia sp.]|nr:hypothetical protein [uncultured Kordia sp.]
MKTRTYFLAVVALFIFSTYGCTEVDSIAEEDSINNIQGIEDGEITDDDI